MFTLPKLPYAYDALEPYIDKETMEIHYTKHHQAYVDKLNAALEKMPELENKTLVELLKNLNDVPDDIRTAIRNNGGGDYNHSFFWPIMKKNGGGKPRDKVAQAINTFFGSFAAFQEQFNQAAKSVFGSGWAWLVVDDENEQLKIITTPNQDTPLMYNTKPLLGLDVWEHAYYLKYQNRRPDYINAWWHVVNWEHVEEHYQNIFK